MRRTVVGQQLESDNSCRCAGTVIKPIFGAASIGVVRVNSQAELLEKYNQVEKEMKSAKIVAGALQQGNPDEENPNFDAAVSPLRLLAPNSLLRHSSHVLDCTKIQFSVTAQWGRGVCLLSPALRS